MSWLPGWDSVTSAHSWSNFYFGASIVALILLGVFEFISHRYSERKDELAAAEQQQIQDQHDKDMAALHMQAANLEKDAAIANERAAQANLEVARLRAPRNLSKEQEDKIVEALRQFPPLTYDLSEPAMLEPGSFLDAQLIEIFTQLGWTFQSYAGELPTKSISLIAGKRIPGFDLSNIDEYKIGINSGLIGIKFTYDWRYHPRPTLTLMTLMNSLSLIDIGTYSVPNATNPGFGSATPVSDVVHIEIGTKQ
jgi:hypothetical protein